MPVAALFVSLLEVEAITDFHSRKKAGKPMQETQHLTLTCCQNTGKNHVTFLGSVF
jgi:hypothetical protein